MATITIDGQQVSVEPGQTVIQAAEKLGIYIPRYCYHPGLSIAGSCRMCLVEIENMPKLQIACYTQAQDGMNVITQSEAVYQARQAMLEFLLINHPLDCPVCDQSGECDLQNFYMEHGRYDSRFIENKIKRKKAFPIGPHVLLDQERCILCTRCVRFTDEISKTHELGCFNRGNRSVIDLYPGKRLENLYSGNVVDICPVGALTEREFRFKCRVWYLRSEESICNGCARGCNINIHFNSTRTYKAGGRRVQRIKPRYNPHVNEWWISDVGRFGFEFIDQNRIEFPYRREENELQNSDWESALDQAAQELQEAYEDDPASIGVILSPQLSNEDLYLAKKLFIDALQLPNIALENPWEKRGIEDDFLLKADRNPNTRGAHEIGIKGSAREILEKAAKGEIRFLYIFWHDFNAPEAREALAKVPFIVFQGVNWNSTAERASLVLPGATHAEKDGTFTNFEGRIQRFKQAFVPLEEARADTEILKQLAAKLGHPVSYLDPETIFIEWQGIGYDEIDEYGMMVGSAPALQA